MELVRINLKNLIGLKEEVVATIGQFDGLHLAHLKLIEKTKKIAREKKLKSAIFTFNPHPDFVLKKDLSNTYVTPLQQKTKLLEATSSAILTLTLSASSVRSVSLGFSK